MKLCRAVVVCGVINFFSLFCMSIDSNWTIYTKKDSQIEVSLRFWEGEDGAPDGFLGPVAQLTGFAGDIKQHSSFMGGLENDPIFGPYKATLNKSQVNLFITETSPDNSDWKRTKGIMNLRMFSLSDLKNAQVVRAVPFSTITIAKKSYKIKTIFWDALRLTPLFGGAIKSGLTPAMQQAQQSAAMESIYVGLIPYNDTSMLLRYKAEANSQVLYPFIEQTLQLPKMDILKLWERTAIGIEASNEWSEYGKYLQYPWNLLVSSNNTFLYFKYISDPVVYGDLKSKADIQEVTLAQPEIVTKEQNRSKVKFDSTISMMNNVYLDVTWPTKDKLLRKGKGIPNAFDGTIILYTKDSIILQSIDPQRVEVDLFHDFSTASRFMSKTDVDTDIKNLTMTKVFLKGPYTIEKNIVYPDYGRSLWKDPVFVRPSMTQKVVYFKLLSPSEYTDFANNYQGFFELLPINELASAKESKISGAEDDVRIILPNGKEYIMYAWIWDLLKASNLLVPSALPGPVSKPISLPLQPIDQSLQKLAISLQNLASKI